MLDLKFFGFYNYKRENVIVTLNFIQRKKQKKKKKVSKVYS